MSLSALFGCYTHNAFCDHGQAKDENDENADVLGQSIDYTSSFFETESMDSEMYATEWTSAAGLYTVAGQY
jgi:hypothetical protein